jgi:PPM family protein phosphatase
MVAPVVMTSLNDCCLLMIADGMGGHAHGAMAGRAILDYLVAAIDRLSNPASCAEAVEEANPHLFELMHEHPEALGMGTALVVAALTANQLVTFNVGDSRCHLFSAGQLVQLSYDDVPEGVTRTGPYPLRHIGWDTRWDDLRLNQDPGRQSSLRWRGR